MSRPRIDAGLRLYKNPSPPALYRLTVNPPLLPRDHYILDAIELRRLRYHLSLRGLVKEALFRLDEIGMRWLPTLVRGLREFRLTRQRGCARVLGPTAASAYLAGPTYVELQIGKETRPVFVLRAGASIVVPYIPREDEDLIFGVAPLIEPVEWSSGRTWGWEVGIGETADETQRFATRVPCAGSNDNFAYFPGDGWIDLRLSLGQRSGRQSVIMFTNPGRTSEGSGPSVAVAAPQVLRRRKAGERRSILLLSIESLTAPALLRKRYGKPDLPHLAKFAAEAVEYPLVYTTVDSTLPFAGSIFTGLLPSQHGIGDYSMGADTFANTTVSRRLPLLQERLKRERFVTLAAAGATRFSGKMGWARGFDIFLQDFRKWSSDAAVEYDALCRIFMKFRDYDKFLFAHIDYLHGPLVCPGASQGRSRLYSQEALANAAEEIHAELFFEQLALADERLGQLLAFLKSEGEWDTTGIILTADHGCGLSWIKNSDYALYEERLRVPLIVKPPSWAAGQPAIPELSNSIPEIFRTIYSWLGIPFESLLESLPQYRVNSHGVAFAETIMNPHKNYRGHSMAVIRPPFKYVCWNRIDWDTQAVDEFGEDRLFRAQGPSDEYDETVDCAHEYRKVTADLRALARATIAENLAFLRRFPPEPY